MNPIKKAVVLMFGVAIVSIAILEPIMAIISIPLTLVYLLVLFDILDDEQ